MLIDIKCYYYVGQETLVKMIIALTIIGLANVIETRARSNSLKLKPMLM